VAISRDTFDPAKNYKRIRFHQDRDLLDSELNELQDIALHEGRNVSDLVLRNGAIISGLQAQDIDRPPEGALALAVAPGRVYVAGRVVDVPGAEVEIPYGQPDAGLVWVEVLRREVKAADDPLLVNPATGEPTAERERWTASLKPRDTTEDPLPERTLGRIAVPVLYVDSRSGRVHPVVPQRSNLNLEDFQGTLDGSRISLGSVTEDQLAFAAAEGLHTLLQNLAERTFDESGSYVVRGLDTFIGRDDGVLVDAVTNAGRAYVKGYRFQLDLPFVSKVPVSVATRSVRGEQKTFSVDERRYPLNNRPLAATSQVEAIAETTANVTRGSVGGGEDTLVPNPVVNIIEVRQGATVFRRGIDWQQSGNKVDWLGSGTEPAVGTTYQVRWTHTRQMVRGLDYVDGGWFGEDGHAPSATYFYLVTAYKMDWEAIEGDPLLRELFHRRALDDHLRGPFPPSQEQYHQVRDSERFETLRPILHETRFDPAKVASCAAARNEMNLLSWSPVAGAEGYRVYRATRGDLRAEFKLLRDVGEALVYIDDAADDLVNTNPPQNETDPSLRMGPPAVGRAEGSVVNFGSHSRGAEPVAGSNVSIDYAYHIGRKDLLYATTREIRRVEGAAADEPKLPAPPENTLPLCSIDCPPNSPAMTVTNFGIARVTMQQLHGVMRDVEALKYNDAQFQQLLVLQNRDSQTKKGIYTDNFQNESQSDPFFPGYSARIDGLRQYAAPPRSTLATTLAVDQARSTVRRFASLATLPATEVVAVDQPEWSELRNVNPFSAFGKPPAEIRVTPNFARKLRTLVTVAGVHFNPSVSNVTVRVDGAVAASNVSTDPQGRFTTSFTVANIWRWGWRTVEASDGTNVARANLRVHELEYLYRVERYAVEADGVARAIREPVAELIWDVQRRPYRFDPLAQTFSFGANRVVSAVGLTFGAKDPAHPVTIQIRGVTAGVPNEQVLAQRTLSPGEVAVNAETKVVFENPFFAQGGASHAVVVMTRSSAYRLRVATMGQRGHVSGAIIAAQAYAPGVLLESSNAETWTPVQGSDLAMRVYALNFASQGELRFNAITSLQFGAFNVDEFSVVPQGTDIRWECSLDNGGSWDAFVPGEEEQLAALGTRIVLRALFSTSSSAESPVLGFHDLHLFTYLNATEGVYVTRELVTSQGIASAKVYTQMSVPSGTSVQWFCSNDGGATWEPMAQEGTRPIDQTWTEFTFARAFASAAGTRVRFKAAMAGTQLVTPRIHTLGVTLA
jgi:hypothetical protein